MAGTSFKGSEIQDVDQFLKDKADDGRKAEAEMHFLGAHPITLAEIGA